MNVNTSGGFGNGNLNLLHPLTALYGMASQSASSIEHAPIPRPCLANLKWAVREPEAKMD